MIFLPIGAARTPTRSPQANSPSECNSNRQQDLNLNLVLLGALYDVGLFELIIILFSFDIFIVEQSAYSNTNSMGTQQYIMNTRITLLPVASFVLL